MGALTYGGDSQHAKNVSVNGYTITPSGLYSNQQGYIITYPARPSDNSYNTLIIDRKVVTLEATKTYDGGKSLTGSVTVATGIIGESLTYTGATSWSQNVIDNGTNYINAITLTNGTGGTESNYALPTLNSTNAPVTINKYAVSLTGSRPYDGSANVVSGIFTIGTLVGTETLSLSGTGTILSGNVGTGKTVTLGTLVLGDGTGSAGNYTFTGGTQTADIIAKTVTLSATKTYDGNKSLTGSMVTIDTGISGETLGYSGATSLKQDVADNGTNYINAITLTNGTGGTESNYALPTLNSTNAPVIITERPVNVTADAKSKSYGTPDPTLTYVAEQPTSGRGLVGGDRFSGTLSREAGESVLDGPYDITQGSLANSNYSISFTGNTFSIIPAQLMVTARNQIKLYNGLGYSGGNGVVFDRVVSSSDIDGTLVYTGTSQGALESGIYVITPGGYSSSNYHITYADGQLTIISSVPTPPEWFLSSPPSSPPATLVEVNVGGKTQSNERGLPDLTSMEALSGNAPQETRVFMPEEFVRSSSSFIFPLPENVHSQLLTSMGPENVFLQDESPLPGWLKYDVENKVFRATDVPPGAIPVTVLVKQGNLSWRVVIVQ